MQLREAIRQLDDDGEHKFLLNLIDSPLFIVREPLNEITKLRMLTHDDLVVRMRSSGLFGQEEVRGGYCVVHHKALKYWGASSHPIKDAGRSLFDQALQGRNISFIDGVGNLL